MIRWHKGHAHHAHRVYTEMLFQIMKEYPSLPDVYSMPVSHIRFFYNGCRGQLRNATKPKA